MTSDARRDGTPRSGPQHTAQYLDTADAVSRWVHEISSPRPNLLAIDTEGASFHRFVDRIYLLQLSTRERTAVVDPLPIGTPTELGAILEDTSTEIVFHDADYDLRLLQQDYGWHVRHIFDTRIAAQLLGIRAFGLAALLEQFFEVRLDKKHQRADWSLRPLTQGMLDYAAQDTMYLPDLRDRLAEQLDRKGRLGWAREEFARLEGTKWAEDASDSAFLRMKGARDLNRRELAILRELVSWRDDVARGLDRATFRVIGNETLLDMTRTKPATREQLGAIKGMPRGLMQSRGDEMLDAVRRGLDVAEADLPRFPRGQRWDRDPDFDTRVSVLRGARDVVATDLDLDAGVLCSRERMEAVARAKPTSMAAMAELPELRRWQVEVLGERFLAALNG